MLYFAWLLYKNIFNNILRNTIFKGGLVRLIIAGNKYKPINLILEYWNRVYAINIKNNKNSTYDTELTFIRLALYSNPLITIRKGVERLFGRTIKGIYTISDPFTNIISYTLKLYKDRIIKRKPTPSNIEPFNILDIFIIG